MDRILRLKYIGRNIFSVWETEEKTRLKSKGNLSLTRADAPMSHVTEKIFSNRKPTEQTEKMATSESRRSNTQTATAQKQHNATHTNNNSHPKHRHQNGPKKSQQSAGDADEPVPAGLPKGLAESLKILKQLFSEQQWTDDDLVSVLMEVNGDLDTAIGRISEGM